MMTIPRVRTSSRLVAGASARWISRFALTAALFASGCDSGHYRHDGHGDIAFTFSPSGEAVVFNAVGEGGRDLFSMDLRTRSVSRIASTPDYESVPAISPDGTSLVYAAGKPGERADHIYVRSIDGKTVKQLTSEDADDSSPSFSPDGSLIVFTRHKNYVRGAKAASGYVDPLVCVMKADGSGLRELTNEGEGAAFGRFTADGKSVSFVNLWSGRSEVPIDRPDAPKKITGKGGPAMAHGTQSPDGRLVAYSQGNYSPDHEIFIANSDGTEPRLLVGRDKQGCFQPAFTPDGKRVFFLVESWPNGPTSVPKRGLWEVDAKGGQPREIADYTLFDDPLHWKSEPRAKP